MITNTLSYFDDDVELEAYYAYLENKTTLPAVLIVHDWSGKNEFARKKAEKIATLGYIGIAIDMFGKGKIGTTKEEKSAFIQPFMQDRTRIAKRMLSAFVAAKTIAAVDKNKIAAIGFCFGGLCALDLARTGIDLCGAISFHGLLTAPENVKTENIKAKILALHGFDDPMAKHDEVIAFGEEMTKAKADWEINVYGNTMHAFTNPEANDPSFGTVYNEKADKRSWIAMQNFLKEAFC